MVDKNPDGYIVSKSNVLNMGNFKNMTKTEIEFFLYYLAKIDSRQPDKNVVEFPLQEFLDAFYIKRIDISELKKKIEKIYNSSVVIHTGGSIEIAHIYASFVFDTRKKLFIIKSNPEIMPMIFDLKERFTSYKFENIRKLGSVSQIRFFEVCKQHQYSGSFEITVEELSEMIGAAPNQEFKNFRRRVLKPCLDTINEKTDIDVSVSYITQGQKVVALHFDISSKEVRKEKAARPKVMNDLELYSAIEQYCRENGYPESSAMIAWKAYKDRDDKAGEISAPLEYMQSVVRNCAAKPKKVSSRDQYAEAASRPQSFDADEFESFAINFLGLDDEN